MAEMRKKTAPGMAEGIALVSAGWWAEAVAMNTPPASTEIPPLMIIGHCPPTVRRVIPTISWISPATTAQAPHTRRTAGTPEAAAKARPIAASTLIAMFTYSRVGAPVVRDARVSMMAEAASNSGYSTKSVAASGPRCLAVVSATRAQTIANPKRTKYSRRKVDAVVAKPGAATVGMVVLSVVMVIPLWLLRSLSQIGDTAEVPVRENERSISSYDAAPITTCQDGTFYPLSWLRRASRTRAEPHGLE